jgi:hypothetical protein
MVLLLSLLAVAVGAAFAPSRAEAFCGFYVSEAGGPLYNNATQVVLMRDGMRTILSMQNNYQGPLEDFAMVIPVPVVLQEDNVKTLDKALFDKIDQLSSPRLVEYWEQDPCNTNPPCWDCDFDARAGAGNNGSSPPSEADPEDGVTVEAEFKVGEYEIAILSAEDAGGLERWLDRNDYNIPDGAAPFLEPYVEGGSYFFVARIIATEVRYQDGRAILSPLRFHYDSPTFHLPIRLGLINAQDEQDLLVYVLGRGQRYNVANYPNVTIPTNINVQNEVRHNFGAFYNNLFERTLEANPGAVVTEYSWVASGCDPCPGPVMDAQDLFTLGADTLGEGAEQDFSWTLTRLHARYGRETLGEDLVFQAAEDIVGGREFVVDAEGNLEEGARPADWGGNNFQGRYAIRHEWEGEIACENPVRGVWGGPPGGGHEATLGSAVSPNTAADGAGTPPADPTTNPEDAQVVENRTLEELVDEAVPELGVTPTEPRPRDEVLTPPTSTGDMGDEVDASGCASVGVGGGLSLGGLLFALALGLRARRRR